MFLVATITFLGLAGDLISADKKIILRDGNDLVEYQEVWRHPNVPTDIPANKESADFFKEENKELFLSKKETIEITRIFPLPVLSRLIVQGEFLVLIDPTHPPVRRKKTELREEGEDWTITFFMVIFPMLGCLITSLINRFGGIKMKFLLLFYLCLLLSIIAGRLVGILAGIFVGQFASGLAGIFAGGLVGTLVGMFAGMLVGGLVGTLAGGLVSELLLQYLTFMAVSCAASLVLAEAAKRIAEWRKNRKEEHCLREEGEHKIGRAHV